jgi:putative membrane protein
LKHFFLRNALSTRLGWCVAALFLIINGWFVANLQSYAELRAAAARPEVAVVSVVFVLVFAAPSFFAVVRWLGAKRGFALIAALGLFAVTIETFALHTGFPYGRFSYGDKIGAELPGGVPWTVCFAWSPLLLGAMPLAHRIATTSRVTRCICAALIVTVFDGVLDPGAVSQNYWQYQAGGVYYGVPISNFCGWLLSGFIGAWIFSAITGDAVAPRSLVRSTLLILLFWSSVCAWSMLVVPALLGAVILLFAFRFYFGSTVEIDRTLSHEKS